MLCTSAILKTFVICSFFFKKWLLTHVLGGVQGHKSSCKHACVAFLTFFPWYHHKVRVKRYFDPDTELLRALHFRNSKNIRNPLIFLQKMASYSCFWRVPSSKILMQASLHRIYDLLTLVSKYDVGVKRYFDPSDTELLRALHSRNSKNIRNLLIFLQKMASYSCFGRGPRS